MRRMESLGIQELHVLLLVDDVGIVQGKLLHNIFNFEQVSFKDVSQQAHDAHGSCRAVPENCTMLLLYTMSKSVDELPV